MDFDPRNNIWKAADGRLFSSARMGPIGADDPDLIAWVEAGGAITTWPTQNGEQTQAALDAVLASYGIGQADAPATTSKLEFYRRMTDDEADAVEMALAQAKVRDRRMFEEAQILNHGDEDFVRLREAVVGMFGEARANELLAPSGG